MHDLENCISSFAYIEGMWYYEVADSGQRVIVYASDDRDLMDMFWLDDTLHALVKEDMDYVERSIYERRITPIKMRRKVYNKIMRACGYDTVPASAYEIIEDVKREVVVEEEKVVMKEYEDIIETVPFLLTQDMHVDETTLTPPKEQDKEEVLAEHLWAVALDTSQIPDYKYTQEGVDGFSLEIDRNYDIFNEIEGYSNRRQRASPEKETKFSFGVFCMLYFKFLMKKKVKIKWGFFVMTYLFLKRVNYNSERNTIMVNGYRLREFEYKDFSVSDMLFDWYDYVYDVLLSGIIEMDDDAWSQCSNLVIMFNKHYDEKFYSRHNVDLRGNQSVFSYSKRKFKRKENLRYGLSTFGEAFVFLSYAEVFKGGFVKKYKPSSIPSFFLTSAFLGDSFYSDNINMTRESCMSLKKYVACSGDKEFFRKFYHIIKLCKQSFKYKKRKWNVYVFNLSWEQKMLDSG
jgi:hypothetical protein